MRYYWNQYSPYVVGSLLAILTVLSFAKCDPEPTVIERPIVRTKVERHTDTVVSTIEVTNRIYIPTSEPTLNTAERATLDTVIRKDSAEALLHVEFNKSEERFENVMAAFTVPVETREITKYVDRETTVEIPVATPDTDDFQWFGLGSAFGVLVSVIVALL